MNSGSESTEPNWVNVHPKEERLCSIETLEDLIRKAYRRGWESSRYWPNVNQPADLTIKWRRDDQAKRLDPTIIERPRQ